MFRQSSEDISIIQISYNGAIINNQNFYDIMIDDYQERAQNYDESIANRDPDSPVNKILDRRNGVLATMVNGVSSGSFFCDNTGGYKECYRVKEHSGRNIHLWGCHIIVFLLGIYQECLQSCNAKDIS